jgi:hypothetical protein
VLNASVNVDKCVFDISQQHVVVRNEVKEPEIHSGVLLLQVTLLKGHCLVHISEVAEEEFLNLCDFSVVCVEFLEVIHHGGDSFD